MPLRKLIPGVVDAGTVYSLDPDAVVADAARLMAKHGIGAVVVLEEGALAGIFTERDIAVRVVGAGRDPGTTRIGSVMTPNPVTLGPDATAFQAFDLMRTRRFRHLPIVADGRVIGMVSIRDLYDVVANELQRRLEETEAFVFGSNYSVPAARQTIN